jgi:hypothetical protein
MNRQRNKWESIPIEHRFTTIVGNHRIKMILCHLLAVCQLMKNLKENHTLLEKYILD